jgi:hypothetical protein
MKASLVAYDFRELHKESEFKIIECGYIKGCQKWLETQIWSLEILGIKSAHAMRKMHVVQNYENDILEGLVVANPLPSKTLNPLFLS